MELFLTSEAVDVNLGTPKATPFYQACTGRHESVLIILLADPRTDVNFVTPFRPGLQ